MRPVCLIGLGQTAWTSEWRREGWDWWGLALDPHAPEFDLCFELHDFDELEASDIGAQRLREIDTPIYLQKAHPDVPNSMTYPLEDVARIGRDYFGSTIAYMLGKAILEQRPKIALFGFDMWKKDGYSHQRPNVEYWLGVAEAKGIEIELPEKSALLKLWTLGEDEWEAEIAEAYPNRYGFREGAKLW